MINFYIKNFILTMNKIEKNVHQIKAIFENLEDIYEKRKLQFKRNKRKYLFRLPKFILIRHILVFLGENEIMNFSLICKPIHELVFSPFSYKVLLSHRRL